MLSAWAYAAPLGLLLAFGVVWGASVIADSAQFSAAVTELSQPAYMGTAITLQTSLGFALTLVTIWTLPLLAQQLPDSSAINLLQGSYAPQTSNTVGWRAWRVASPSPSPTPNADAGASNQQDAAPTPE